MSDLKVKKCHDCAHSFPMTVDFFYRKKTVGSEDQVSGWSHKCKPCEKKYKKYFWQRHRKTLTHLRKAHREKNKQEILAKEASKRLASSLFPDKILERRKLRSLTGTAKYIQSRMAGWRSSAKKRGLEFSLKVDEIVSLYEAQERKCFYTGRDIVLSPNNQNVLSLDRLDSSKGYTTENVVICSLIVNKMKQDLSLDDFRSLCREVLR